MFFRLASPHAWSAHSPLLAAVIAPISTLFDIPALTENWFRHNAAPLPDPTPNLVLSILSLVFNILANGLLMMRFSVKDSWWKPATWLSLCCWIVKFIIALCNIIVFGHLPRNGSGISYDEGFWCAIVSVIATAVIIFLLVLPIATTLKASERRDSINQIQMRVAGRHFMLQNVFFVSLIGILAVFMSQLEEWSYLQGIYFSVVTFLTVGFGDFYPTRTVTRIVLFPLALAGIAQLASLVGMIVSFFSNRIEAQAAERRARFENEREEAANKPVGESDFDAEMRFLYQLHQVEDRWRLARDLSYNLSAFLIFWVIGALIFSQTESWTYGQGLYFCYVFFFSVGYGDFVPITPAGRVIFCVYSLIAVPIMASFAVQTVTRVFRKISDRRLQVRRAEAGIGIDLAKERRAKDTLLGSQPKRMVSEEGSEGSPKTVEEQNHERGPEDWFISHTRLIAEKHEDIKKLWPQGRRSSITVEATESNEPEAEREDDFNADKVLTVRVLELAVEMERWARRVMMAQMKEGTMPQILLKADSSVQLRHMKELARQAQTTEGAVDVNDAQQHAYLRTEKGYVTELMKTIYEEEMDMRYRKADMNENQILEALHKYRESFAELLAAGSLLMELKGEEKLLFERRLMSDSGPSRS